MANKKNNSVKIPPRDQTEREARMLTREVVRTRVIGVSKMPATQRRGKK